MWKELMLSARSRSLFDWHFVLPELDMTVFKERYLDPAPGASGQVLCPTMKDCPEADCHCRAVRDLSTGSFACCTRRWGVPNVAVTANELANFSLGYARFHALLCRELGLELSHADLDDHFFWELGVFKCGAAKRRPVYLSYLQSFEQLDAKVRVLLASTPTAFALVVFDRTLIRSSTIAAMTAEKCLCVALPDVLRMNRDCSITRIVEREAIFDCFKSAEGNGGIKTYLCAAGTKWSDICLTHEDSETVYVSRRGESPVPFSYRAMGLFNAKNDKPSLAFLTLLKLLDSPDGSVEVPAKTSPQYDFLVQRKKELQACFRKIFPTVEDGPPIIYDRNTFRYTLRFLTRHPAVITK